MILSDNMRGAGLMMVSMAAFTLNDTCIKVLAGQVPLFQIIFLRGALTCLLLWIAGRRLGAIQLNLPRRDWGLIVLRGAADVGATYMFLSALMQMPIANVTAILQALPLTVTLMAALVLGEPLGWRRLAAIAIGFVGVMLIVRPGAEGFTVWSLYALGAVGFVTIRDLAARQLGPGTPSITVALTGAVAVAFAAGVATWIAGDWVAFTPRQGGLIALASVFILGGYLASVMVMRVGEIGFVAPFRYTGLIWALVLGLLVFNDWPDNPTLIGAAIVVATGLFTLYRERVMAQRLRRTKA